MSSRKTVLCTIYEMPEFVGFQTMVILDPYGITFDDVGVFGLAFYSNPVQHTVKCREL